MRTTLHASSPVTRRAPPAIRRRLPLCLFLGAAALAPPLAPVAGGEETADAVRHAGDVGQFVPHVAGLTLVLARRDGRGLGQLVLATASTLAVVHTLKPVIDRRRPDGGGRSFPSGHTAMAFAGAGFIQRRYGWAFGLPAYAAGAFVGYSRVHAKEHHTSDVLASGVIGVASNLAFTRRYRGMTVRGAPSSNGPGLALSVSW